MSTILVFEQMMVILLLMLVGAITQKIKQIDQSQQQLLSWLVVNVFNPALSISSVLSSDAPGNLTSIAYTFGIAILMYGSRICVTPSPPPAPDSCWCRVSKAHASPA